MTPTPLSILISLLSLAAVVLPQLTPSACGDWPALRGDPQHTGRADARPRQPLRIAWAVHFDGERLGTAMEPIVAGGRVFVATHAGSVYALDADTATPLWRFRAGGPFLQSPAVSHHNASGDSVLAACADGNLYALDARTGIPRWSHSAGPVGFCASPLVVEGSVVIGSRDGTFLRVDVATGREIWRRNLGAPVRQTAAADGAGRVFVTAEDMALRAVDLKTGQVLWTSTACSGQTARDYYPVVVESAGRTRIVVRTNPVLPFSDLLNRDRELLCANAGMDCRGWKEMDAWVKGEGTRGTPELRAKEQAAIAAYLVDHPGARTFFLFDAATGEALPPPPVLWCGGCQGVPAPPAVAGDGTLFTSYRTAYSNWNLGVAPLIGLGELDLATNRLAPLRHQGGAQPPWNTFWGTADEAQTLNLAGDLLLIVHQSTLSGFDLNSSQLFPVRGDRDSWAGFRNLPWAMNEWNGPARGGVAVVGDRVYWFSGSRLLCAAAGPIDAPAAPHLPDVVIDPARVPTRQAPRTMTRSREWLMGELERGVGEVVSADWAPLLTEPGLSGAVFSFNTGGEVFEALARAYPHLRPELQAKVKAYLVRQWEDHPPLDRRRWPTPGEGRRRELFSVPQELLTRPDLGTAAEGLHPFGNVYAVWVYGRRCGEEERVAAAWPAVRLAYEGWIKTGWKLDPTRGDLYANRYLASLIAFARLARSAGEPNLAADADAAAERTTDALAAWWERAAREKVPRVTKDIGEWDHFIKEGDSFFFKLAPHRQKIALFHELTPEVADLVKTKAPASAEALWNYFQTLCPTWPLTGEERQVHTGENFADPPDFAAAAFAAEAWLGRAPAARLPADADIPWGKADLNYLTKLAVALEAASR